MNVGAYYFDGWAGRNKLADDPSQPWARNAPAQLTQRMIQEFPEREPVWGWRDDSLEIMERQIDLAADHGLGFFAFCWYWRDSGRAINTQAIRDDPLHTGLELYLQAKNNRRLKFCFLVANHEGAEIKGTECWKQAGDFWMPYLKHPQYLAVAKKPLIIIFESGGGDKAGLAYLQETAHQSGLPGVAVACQAFGARCEGETGYTLLTHYAGGAIPGWEKGLEKHTYQELVESQEQRWKGSKEQPYIPCVMAGWDRRPWENTQLAGQKYCWYHPDRTPEAFGAHLRDALNWMDRHPDQTTAEQIAVIYAWNEFGEGGYLAPTKGDPTGQYLKALRSVAISAPQRSSGRQNAGG
ncbi:MAG: glycoside hydrolase family 99-like domain-containing protein [Planctomycetota bacterium]